MVIDHAAGDAICSECGLVLEQRVVDEDSEWRTFSDSATSDPVRVGGRSNPLLADGGLYTAISTPNGTQGGSVPSLRLRENGGANPDRSLLIAFQSIAIMADRLGLVQTIKDRANEIYKQVLDLNSIRGRSKDVRVAACLYIACRQEDKPRSFKEIAQVANGASKKDIGRAAKLMVNKLEEDKGVSMEMGVINAGDFLRRFCSRLNMENHEIRAAIDTAMNVGTMLDIRKSPISVAAAAIYMISQLNEKEKRDLKSVSGAAGVGEDTIRRTYRDLYPHAANIIPEWFLNGVDLRNLPAP